MDSKTLVYAIYEWLDSMTYIPNELFDVLLRDIAIMLIGFEIAMKMPGLAEALVTPRRMRGGVSNQELAELRQAAEANNASQNAKNKYRNAQLTYNSERQLALIREERPEALSLQGAAPLPREPKLPEDLEQFFRRIQELRVAKRAIESDVATARQALGNLDTIVNVANISRRYRTENETTQEAVVIERLAKINQALTKVRREIDRLSDPNLPRLVKSAVFSAAGTVLTFGGLTLAAGVVTGAALLTATGVGLAATAAAAATAAVADNPATVQRTVTTTYNLLSDALSSIGMSMLTSQHIENYGTLPDYNTPLVQAASRARRPYGATINLTAEPSSYNERGVPIYNYMREGQAGVPYYDPSALVINQDDTHPIRAMLAYPTRIAATVIFVGGTNLIYQAFKYREEISLRAEEGALQRNKNSLTLEINRLIDIARARHAEAKARARDEFERQRNRVDEQERIITEAYAEFVRQRAARVEAYQVLMQRWYESRQAALIAERVANAQVDFANAMIALARGPAAIEGPAPQLLVLNQRSLPGSPPGSPASSRSSSARGGNKKTRRSRR